MMKQSGFLVIALLGVLVSAVWSPAQAHTDAGSYGQNMNYSLRSVGAPQMLTGIWTASHPVAERFYLLGTQAFNDHDYATAIDRFTVAAQYASKSVEYSLGVMHFRGVSVTADRSLGAAWMELAAQRGNPDYVTARDAMVSGLTDAQIAQADKLFQQLPKKYGDQAVSRR